MQDDLFNTKEKQEKGILAFQSLMANEGWILACQIFDLNIKFVEDLLLDSEDLDEEKRKDLQRRRYYQKQLKELPQRMIKDLTKTEAEEIDLDPYA